ncbi:biogenesis of lysosome-related organelles complex-1 subunit 2-domain-containing protein [Gilbertella persicaria]|uniref:Bioproteinsis of lysosome-organelles complex 1 subunit 2 n=1 Tax=Rhizopus stolonifer TaxID=4846 RepID=A0A367KVZ2_RHIST|nr:biogenesis of lysosome-related organelles complex-1 subunit 2-domain-containing protein [Gilbertella persicaria]KAI8098400.1 biogenesis of lysosome-related organelles complex-1 subunit 2-domain-containing protein [Gilbertella persicaria]RCI06366.1 Bioproteinsis of lysosome- organelles complex 1 subunit 2 [Rhizopus stolonifer]
MSDTSSPTLKPDEYTKGLDQEHIKKLTEDAYKHFTEYTKAELKLTVEDCQLLETMNKATQEKYAQLGQMNQRIMKEISGLQANYADFSGFLKQIDTLHQQTIQLEKTARALNDYSKYLENKLLKVQK